MKDMLFTYLPDAGVVNIYLDNFTTEEQKEKTLRAIEALISKAMRM